MTEIQNSSHINPRLRIPAIFLGIGLSLLLISLLGIAITSMTDNHILRTIFSISASIGAITITLTLLRGHDIAKS